MQYYKIIQNQNIIGVGAFFLKWNPKHQAYFYCQIEEAQCVQDAITEKLYHDNWFNAIPLTANKVELATVELIEEQEYNTLYNQLIEGISVQEQIIPPIIETEQETIPIIKQISSPQTSIQQMRDTIDSLMSMKAKDDILKDSYFILHDEIYQAITNITKGDEIELNKNCIKRTLNDILNNQKK